MGRGRPALLRRAECNSRSGIRHWQSAIRLFLWLILLLGIAVGIWAVLSAHRERVRGMPRDFPNPVVDADVPILGINVRLDRYDERELASALARVADGGFVWVRQSFAWSQVKREGPTEDFDWSGIDRIVRALDGYGDSELQLVAVLEDDSPIPPEDPEGFAAFAGAFAGRYGDQVDHYQIWDEPNLAAHWGGNPVNPSAYAHLLALSAEAIRAADPEARILLAGLAPTTETGPNNLSEVRYLDRLYQVGAASSFDIVAAKPYGFDTGPDDRRVNKSLLNVSRLLLLREVMVGHGDAGKAVWASHWGWNALPEDWDGASSIWGQTDEATQAAHSVAMLERARKEWPWMGAMILETLQPEALPSAASWADVADPRWGFAIVAPDGNPRPVYRSLADWTRSLPGAAPVGGYPPRNRWTTYDGSWRVGPLQADVGRSPAAPDDQAAAASANGDRACFRFDGTRVALTVRRGPYRGFLYVTVDGEPANALPRDERGRAYVVLHDGQSHIATVPLATGLEPGAHTVEVTADGGQGQWPLIDWRVGATPVRDGTSWKLGGLTGAALVILGLLLREVRQVPWACLAETCLGLSPERQAGLAVGLTGVLWATAALSWGRLTPLTPLSSTCFVLSLITMPALTFIFAVRPDLGLMLVALAAPFYLAPDTMVYRTVSVPEILVVLCFVAYIAARIASAQVKRSGWRRGATESGSMRRCFVTLTRTDAAVVLLGLAALLAGVAADDRLAALFELRSVFLLPGLYYALLRLTPLDHRAWRLILGGFLLGGMGVALLGLAQGALGSNLVAAEGGLLRIRSIYPSPNGLALYLGRVWPFVAAGAAWGRGSRRRVVCVLALLLVTVALGLTFSRGALLLALPASVLAMGWWAGGRYRWMALALVLAAGLGLIPLLRVPRFVALLDLGRGSTFFRLKLWRSSLQMIWERPLLGVGPGNFLGAYQSRYVLPTAWEEFNLEHAHNVLLDHWTRLGVLGVAAGVAVQIAFWQTLRRWEERRVLMLGMVGSMAALLAHGLVDNPVFFPDLALAFFLMLAMAEDGRSTMERIRCTNDQG